MNSIILGVCLISLFIGGMLGYITKAIVDGIDYSECVMDGMQYERWVFSKTLTRNNKHTFWYYDLHITPLKGGGWLIKMPDTKEYQSFRKE